MVKYFSQGEYRPCLYGGIRKRIGAKFTEIYLGELLKVRVGVKGLLYSWLEFSGPIYGESGISVLRYLCFKHE